MQAPSKIPICGECGKPARLTTGSEVYPGAWQLVAQNFWVCQDFPRCDSYAGVHGKGKLPKSNLSSRPLRTAKVAAHAAFDRIWKEMGGDRSMAYAELAKHLGVKEAHIGWMNKTECEATVAWSVEAIVFLAERRHGLSK